MQYKKLFPYILLFAIGIFPLLDLFHPGLPLTHDGQDHIARIANFYKNLQEGILIPRWAGNLNWGYGHPILEFLYPLPSYIASFFHFLGFSLINSGKIVFGLGMMLSGFSMYAWLSKFWTKQASFIGALLYVFSPYRFVELYVRGDIGENLAFIFIPLVLLFIHNLSVKQTTKNVIGGAFSICLLILAHNAISLMFIPFILLYGLYKLFFHAKNKKRFFIFFSFLFFLGFGLAAFFWIPALLEGKFTLRNIVTAGQYATRFVSFPQLVFSLWSYGGTGEFSVQLGVVNWLALIFAIVSLPALLVKKNKKFPFVLLVVLYTFFAIFLMLPISKLIWQHSSLLQDFQFPWRFLAITIFTTAILGGLLVELISSRFRLFFCLFLFLAIIFLNKDYWHANGYLFKPESFFTGVYNGTTDTGESSPIWSVRFMEKRPSAPIDIIEGVGKVISLSRTSTKHTYKVILAQRSRLVENTLYFPGWRVQVDGKSVPIQFQDPTYRGLMTFYVPAGTHWISVVFGQTKLRLLADAISILTILIICIIGLKDIIKAAL